MRKKRASSGRGNCCLRHRSRTDRKSGDLDTLCQSRRLLALSVVLRERPKPGLEEASGRQRRRGIPTGTSPSPATHTPFLSSATRPPPTVLREPSALASKTQESGGETWRQTRTLSALPHAPGPGILEYAQSVSGCSDVSQRWSTPKAQRGGRGRRMDSFPLHSLLPQPNLPLIRNQRADTSL